jgi:Restriction alleviation protein Lar
MTAPAQVQLLPCPFCGGEAECDSQQPYRALSSGRIGTRFAIYCTSCDADMGFCREDIESRDWEAAAEQIIAAWNTRHTATADALEAMREALEAHDKNGTVEFANLKMVHILTAAIAKIEGDTK